MPLLQKWEYKVFHRPIPIEHTRQADEDFDAVAKELNDLGLEGWELVDVIPTHRNRNAIYIFKRPLEA